MNDSKILNQESNANVNETLENKEVVTVNEQNNEQNSSPTEEVNTAMNGLSIVPKEEDKKEKVEGTTENKGEASTTVADTTKKEKDDSTIKGLTHLEEKFVYELMSVPTLSKFEYRLVTFIMLWAKRNHVDYEFDTYGNIYLTKGKVKEGEYYPCMTAHLDTVQQKQKAYVQAGAELEVKTRVINGKHEIYVDGMGIGGDDKAGVLIALSMFKHVDVLKAAFFLEEEIGCCGSKALNTEWFKDVGYVLGYDSPDLNRAAWACSGTKLFSAKFFKEHMQEICKKHGLTKFFSEPFTDVKQIREKTNIICMNFGSGYYNGHMTNEYCVIEEMDIACRMGHDLIKHLGKQRYELEHKEKSYGGWVQNGSSRTWKRSEEDEDEKFLRTLGETSRYSTYGSGSQYSGYSRDWDAYDDDFYGGYGAAGNSRQTHVSDIANGNYKSEAKKKDEEVNIETVRYIVEKYDNHIDRIKESVEKRCKELGIDFSAEFSKVFEESIRF